LPDVFSNQKSQLGKFFEGLGMEDVGLFNGHLVYFAAMYILDGQLVHFVVIWYILVCCTTKNLATLGSSQFDGDIKILQIDKKSFGKKREKKKPSCRCCD
jgi:hypothetical protein